MSSQVILDAALLTKKNKNMNKTETYNISKADVHMYAIKGIKKKKKK